MRIFISLLLIFTTAACSVAQPGKTKIDVGTNKKSAQKAYDDAYLAYTAYDYSTAIELYKKAIDKDDEFIAAYMSLGQVYIDLGDHATAVSLFKKVIELSPGFNLGYLYAGKSLFALGAYDDAKLMAERYLILTPNITIETKKKIDLLIASCEFAKEATTNPVEFNPVNMGPNINSEYSEYWPAITVDGSTFIFTRRIKGENENFFIAKYQDTGWGKAKDIGLPINTGANEGAETVSSDGKFIFYTACQRPFGNGSCDIYVSKLEGDKWSEPENLGYPISTKDWDSQPSISADGKTLYFASSRKGGYGGLDIWAAHYGSKGWEEPYNLGPNINTAEDDQSPFIHPDNQTLYFSSNGWPGMGNADIYYSRLGADGKWQKCVNIGYPINTYADENSLITDRLGNLAFYASGKEGGYGGLDFYMFELPEAAKPHKMSYVKGTIYDAETKQRLKANIELIELNTGKSVLKTMSNDDGSYLVLLEADKDYALNVNKQTYLFHSENFSLAESNSTEPYNIDVYLNKIKENNTIVMRNVFFETGMYDLKPTSKSELDKLVDFLNANPTLTIEIGGHTDDIGNDNDNKVLSQNRANSVMTYLINAGIDKKRLTAKGYGETKPVATNATPEGRALNRRTEITITGQ